MAAVQTPRVGPGFDDPAVSSTWKEQTVMSTSWRVVARALTALTAVTIGLTPAAAQVVASAASQDTASAESAVVAPGPQYHKSGFWTVFAGRHYRELWVTP